jgi:hypothetical protein
MPVVIAPAADARPYKLIGLNRHYEHVSLQQFSTLEELAKAAVSADYYAKANLRSILPPFDQAVRLKALNPSDKVLSVEELVAWGRRLRQTEYLSRRHAHVFREGPVQGIRKWRGGYGVRNHRVQAERRDNHLVVFEDGEVSARATRCGGYLPNSWDGRRRIVQRCWKSQHKGRKSWDRPTLRGTSEG